jgi:hypothetical protein
MGLNGTATALLFFLDRGCLGVGACRTGASVTSLVLLVLLKSFSVAVFELELVLDVFVSLWSCFFSSRNQLGRLLEGDIG